MEQLSWLALIESALQDISLEAKAAQTTMDIVVVNEPPLLTGQRLLLAILLRNLLHNAIRYGKAGGKVDIVLNKDHLTIHDDGQG